MANTTSELIRKYQEQDIITEDSSHVFVAYDDSSCCDSCCTDACCIYACLGFGC